AQVLQPGDVIYADPLFSKDGKAVEGQYRLRQIPELSGAMVAMDPHTGRGLAVLRGFPSVQTQRTRAPEPFLQPGSTFKPIVYSTALDNGYTGSTMMIDGPIEIDQGQGNIWRPENFSTGKYQGQVTL
ncbi:penicillin-binding protein, partial [Escherichia coli]|uniref:penicillin-binding transpeptidase domain-containing protein n=1 Tax=Escherichia coli TaxID=562 RepID=UPI000F9489F4